MPWIVAKQPLHCGLSLVLLPVGWPLPGWAQSANMIRVLRSLHGEGCVRYEPDGPTCPVPRADVAPAPPPAVPMSEAEQKDASWREWIQMKAQPWKHPAAPVEEKPNG